MVTTLKDTVDHVVTEWGVAELGGDRWERARALIDIVHPSTRDDPEQEAHQLGLILRTSGLAPWFLQDISTTAAPVSRSCARSDSASSSCSIG